MSESIDEVCCAMDQLAMRELELLQGNVVLALRMEDSLRDGHIELAKARYIRGKESVGVLQIPGEDNEVKSLFDLETTLPNEEELAPRFRINLRKIDENGEKLRDPLKWFGVLVPQNLKNAQKCFREALYLAVQRANINLELANTSERMKVLNEKKGKLVNQGENTVIKSIVE